jgi:hypothetical protein
MGVFDNFKARNFSEMLGVKARLLNREEVEIVELDSFSRSLRKE